MVNDTSIIKKNGIRFYIDDSNSLQGLIMPNSEQWQFVKLKDTSGNKRKIRLSAGKHLIIFTSMLPELPPIEFIRLTKSESDADLNNEEWNNYFENAKKNNFKINKYTVNKINENPMYEYDHQLNTYFTYTYFSDFYFNVGTVVFETKKADPYSSDPVMHLFNIQNPDNGSWGDDDSGEGYQSKITAYIQVPGYYRLLVRSYSSNQTQTTDLYLNNALYASNIVISGANLDCDHTLTEEINYFTCFPTGDPTLWIQSEDLKILGHNDDYTGTGDFTWQQNARVKKSYSSHMTKCIVTSSSTYYPTGYCDVYMRCKNVPTSTINNFRNLNPDDAIMSGGYIGNYNCISWTGGITSYPEWPLNPGSRYYVQGDSLASFDNFYANNPLRYSGAEGWNYTRTGATQSNNVIDLWYYDGYYVKTYTHAANGHSHGYDWESKAGDMERFFHPRYAFNGSSYGYVKHYYKLDDVLLKKDFITSEESIQRGLSKLDKVTLSSDEIQKINELKAKLLNENEINEFFRKYDAWKKNWTDPSISFQSNPRAYASSSEYYDFLNYCISKNKKVLPLILEKLNEDDFYLIVAMEDLTYAGNEKLMEEIHKENKNNMYTDDGVFVIHTLICNWLKFGKRLLTNFEDYQGFTPQSSESVLNYGSNTTEDKVVMQNYPNPFNPITTIEYTIPTKEFISLKVYDILGREIVTLVNEEKDAGTHKVEFDGSKCSSGVYFYRIQAGKFTTTKKFILVR
jgi:hypothetical protein